MPTIMLLFLYDDDDKCPFPLLVHSFGLYLRVGINDIYGGLGWRAEVWGVLSLSAQRKDEKALKQELNIPFTGHDVEEWMFLE